MSQGSLSDDGDRSALGFLYRHFLSLGWAVQRIGTDGSPLGPVEGFCTSGSLFRYRGRYSILTAGHVLRDIDQMIQGGHCVIRSCSLLDSFGHEAVHKLPIPFDYAGATKFAIYDKDEGLDFGFVGLDDYYLTLIEKNGVKAITEDNWRSQESVTCESYMMLGIPSALTSVDARCETDGQYSFDFNVTNVAFRIDRLPEPPKGSIPTKHERFVGRIHDQTDISSIEGMSGGPILGFARRNGQLLYWVVAIQSGWLPDSRITFGCPIPTIGSLLDCYIDGDGRAL